MYYINPKKVKPFWKGLGILAALICIVDAALLVTNIAPIMVSVSLYGLGMVGGIVVLVMMIIQGAENRP